MQGPPPGKLEFFNPDEVSHVDYGANDRPFLVRKFASSLTPDDHKVLKKEGIIMEKEQKPKANSLAKELETALRSVLGLNKKEADEPAAAQEATAQEPAGLDEETLKAVVKSAVTESIEPVTKRVEAVEESLKSLQDEFSAHKESQEEAAKRLGDVEKSAQENAENLQKAFNASPPSRSNSKTEKDGEVDGDNKAVNIKKWQGFFGLDKIAN